MMNMSCHAAIAEPYCSLENPHELHLNAFVCLFGRIMMLHVVDTIAVVCLVWFDDMKLNAEYHGPAALTLSRTPMIMLVYC
jgi:hypothetical protein